MFFCSLIFQYCKWSIHHSNYNVRCPKQLSLSRPNRNETFGHAFFTWLVQHISPFIAVHLSVKKNSTLPLPPFESAWYRSVLYCRLFSDKGTVFLIFFLISVKDHHTYVTILACDSRGLISYLCILNTNPPRWKVW